MPAAKEVDPAKLTKKQRQTLESAIDQSVYLEGASNQQMGRRLVAAWLGEMDSGGIFRTNAAGRRAVGL